LRHRTRKVKKFLWWRVLPGRTPHMKHYLVLNVLFLSYTCLSCMVKQLGLHLSEMRLFFVWV